MTSTAAGAAISTAPEGASVTAYALLDRDRVACPLARWAQAR